MEPTATGVIGKDEAEKNLQRHLDWIARYDVRSSLIVGICVGMLGVITANAPSFMKWNIAFDIAFAAAAALIIAALVFICVGQFPRTRSPNNSLLFFGTISAMKLDDYRRQFIATKEAQYVDDVLAQVHVNALIVSTKFWALKVALILLLISIVPWCAAIYLAKTI